MSVKRCIYLNWIEKKADEIMATGIRNKDAVHVASATLLQKINPGMDDLIHIPF